MSGNLLITGGTGFIGKALLREIAKKKDTFQSSFDEICVLSRSPSVFLQSFPEFGCLEGVRFHKGDIMVSESLPKEKFSHVIHGAAESTNGPKLSALYRFDQIVSGTRNLLDWSVKTGVHRFLFLSSGAVYGGLPPSLTGYHEDQCCALFPDRPEQSYAIAKLTAEHSTLTFGSLGLMSVSVARCFSFSGVDLPLTAHFAFGNFIHDALFSEKITINGDGNTRRSYLDQRDLAHWLFTILLHGSTTGIYNVGSDRVISIFHLAEMIKSVLCPEKSISKSDFNTDDSSRRVYFPNVLKANKELGLVPAISLRQSIIDTANANLR